MNIIVKNRSSTIVQSITSLLRQYWIVIYCNNFFFPPSCWWYIFFLVSFPCFLSRVFCFVCLLFFNQYPFAWGPDSQSVFSIWTWRSMRMMRMGWNRWYFRSSRPQSEIVIFTKQGWCLPWLILISSHHINSMNNYAESSLLFSIVLQIWFYNLNVVHARTSEKDPTPEWREKSIQSHAF